MAEKTRRTTVRMLAFLVAAVGIAVMVGWTFGVDGLKSVHPALVTMKFTTALSFVLSSGIIAGLVSERRGHGGAMEVVSPLLGFALILVMGTMLLSGFTGVRTGIEDLWIEEHAGAVASVTPGRPSVGTMVAFLLIATVSLLSSQRRDSHEDVSKAIGWIVSSVGAVAFIGYLAGFPPMYFQLEGASTGMALHTALTLVLCGAGIVMAFIGDPATDTGARPDPDVL